MKTPSRTGYSLLIAFALFGCHTPQKKKVTSDSLNVVTPIRKQTTNPQPKTNSLEYDKTKVIRQVFVIIKQGIPFRETSAEQANILGQAEYGQRLEVVEELGDWIAVRERIGRNYTKDDGTRVESSGWEKVYVAKNETGSLNQIQLSESDLNIITSSKINGNSESFEKGKPLTTYLKFELITRSLFENQKANVVEFLLPDTNSILKRNGIITLPISNKSVKIKDKQGEEDREEYKYLGQVPFLNQYLVEGSYYESSDFSYFDKTSGKETQTFADYPRISANKKNIISIYGNPYESTSDLELYTINNQQIKLVMTASFGKWFLRIVELKTFSGVPMEICI